MQKAVWKGLSGALLFVVLLLVLHSCFQSSPYLPLNSLGRFSSRSVDGDRAHERAVSEKHPSWQFLTVYRPESEAAAMGLRFPTTMMHLLGDPQNAAWRLNISTYEASEVVSRPLHLSGRFEPELVGGVLAYLQRHEDLDFIDVGANLGVFTLNVATMRPKPRRVIAVEAHEGTCQRLYQSLQRCNCSQRVTLLNNALSNTRGFLAMGATGDGFSRLKHDNFAQSDVRMKSIVMDDLQAVGSFSRAIMKMDIEGSEWRAMGNASEFFASVFIPMVLMEWNLYENQLPKSAGSVIIDFFRERAYEPHSGIPPAAKKLEWSGRDSWGHDVVWLKRHFAH